MNDIIFHILLQMVTNFEFSVYVVNIKTAFLWGDLEEEIFMECPQGMNGIEQDDCIILDECTFSIAQTTILQRAIKILIKNGFSRGSVDPCLFMK